MGLINQLMGEPDPERNSEPAPRFRPGEENDRWNAARLLAEEGDKMLFVAGKGWGIWDGGRFDFSDGKHRALSIADKLQGIIAADAREAWAEDFSEFEVMARIKRERLTGKPARFASLEEAVDFMREEKAVALMKLAVKCGNIDKMKKALEVAEARKRVALELLDSDPYSFTCPNGRVDLKAAAEAEDFSGATPSERAAIRAKWLKPHDRDLYPSKCAGVEFDPAAEAPEWRAFIEMILPDQAVRDCFQRSMGAMLFGRNEPQVAYLFRGSGGNGKSTAVNAIANVLGLSGGYAVPCKIEMFLAAQNQGAGQATPEEVDIPGARALIASEPEPTDELSAKKIKSLTGGDPRPARALNMPQFYYRPTGFPILSFNRTPRIKNEDEGTRRRLIFFPFDVNLRALPPEKRRSPVVMDAALAAQGPGILNWMLDGWREYRFRADAGIGTPPGIDPSPVMSILKDSLLEHADPIGEFIKDCCDPHGDGLIRTQEFYRVYSEWCELTGAAIYGKQTVNRILQEKGVGRRKTGGGVMHWAGLRWQVSDNMRTLLGACGIVTPPPPAPPEPAPF